MVEGLFSSPVPQVLGVKFHVPLPIISDATRTEPVIPATTIHGATSTLPSGVGPFQAGDDPEVWSSLQESFFGMEFDSLLGAKALYNAYAFRLGFLTKSSTSRQSAYTGVVEKNKHLCAISRGSRKVTMWLIPL